MEKFTGCENDFFELTVRIMIDDSPNVNPDIAYVFAQTNDNARSVLDTAAELYKKGLISKIGVCDGETDHGYPGFDNWRHVLKNILGVPERIITPVKIEDGTGVNTLTEAQALIDLMLNTDWKSGYIIAPPFHQIRAFATTASIVIKKCPRIKIYNNTGLNLGWNKTSRHSQGILSGKRYEFLHAELEKLSRYCQKGDILPLPEILNYLKNRDK